MTGIDLPAEVDRLREKLLDLSMRNPLLNYRKSRRRTLQIVDELPSMIYERLVEQGRKFRFDYVVEQDQYQDPPPGKPAINEKFTHEIDSAASETSFERQEPRSDSELPTEPASPNREHRHLFDDKLQTPLTEHKLDSVLRYMQREARTALQETGINYLHLVIGFLSWKESEHSDRERLAPLILIPIELERKSDARSGKSRYSASWTEDDVTGNLCLRRKLERDFGLDLPDYDFESNPETYIGEVVERIRAYSHWEVRREALIGFFSFHKLSMYADIDPVSWELDSDTVQADLIEKVICGADGSSPDTSLYASDYDIDTHGSADDILLAMDADSSQHSALCDIRDGKNLVIEGPPGTGKSQTIGNAIADAIGSGKSVLFVAEKLTALQVVHDRLEKLGLSDFCLELHSDGSSPRHVFESLHQRLATQYQDPQQLELTRQWLQQRRSKLNDFVDQMGQRVGPDLSPLYEVMWQIVELRNDGAKRCPIEIGAHEVDREAFRRACDLLDIFAKRLEDLPSPKQCPWWGYFLDSMAFRAFSEIESTLDKLSSQATTARKSFNQFASLIGADLKAVSSIANSISLQRIRQLADEAPHLNPERIQTLLTPESLSQARTLVSELQDVRSQRGVLTKEYGLAYDRLCQFTTEVSPCLDIVCRAHATPDEFQPILAWADRALRGVDSADNAGTTLRSLNIETPPSLGGIRNSIQILRVATEMVDARSQSLNEEMFSCNTRVLYSKAKNAAEQLVDRQVGIERELSELKSRFTLNWKSTAEHRAVLRECRSVLRNYFDGSRTLAEIAATQAWANKALKVVQGIRKVVPDLNQLGIGKIDSFQEFAKAVRVLQLLQHPIVKDAEAVTEDQFSDAGKSAFRRAREQFAALSEQCNSIEQSFYLPSAPKPEELVEITRGLRRHHQSWLKAFNGEYRAARAALNEFSQVGKKQSLVAWIRALEDLQAFEESKLDFANAPAIRDSLGSHFEGFDTDWDKLKTVFDWVHTVQQLGIEYRQIKPLVDNRDISPSEELASLRKRKADFDELFLDANPSRPAVLVSESLADVELSDLENTLSSLASGVERLISLSDQIGIDERLELGDLKSIIDSSERIVQIEGEERESHNQDLRRFVEDPDFCVGFGELFAGVNTDWDTLAQTVDWVEDLKSSKVDHAMVASVCDQIGECPAPPDSADLERELVEAIDLFDAWPAEVTGRMEAIELQRMPLSELRDYLRAIISTVEKLIVTVADYGVSHLTLDQLGAIVDRMKRIGRIDERIRDAGRWKQLVDSRIHRDAIDDADTVGRQCDWANSVLEECWRIDHEQILSLLAKDPRRGLRELADSAGSVSQIRKDVHATAMKLQSFADTDESWLAIHDSNIVDGTIEERAEILLSNMETLPTWAEFSQSYMDCRQEDLRDFCEMAMSGEVDGDNLTSSYRLTILERDVETAFRASRILSRATGASLDSIRQDFAEYDRVLRKLTADEVAHRASLRQVPVGISRGRVGELTELSLIRHETQKQKRHCRIRDLVSRAGEATLALKPCFMMSPLSVSRFIPQGTIQFDMVIMDEASQIKPEDALGTILRAKQLVVVGDPKQLPPTSFFDRIDDELEDDESTQLDNTESILEAAMKVFQPFRRLRWHYRSTHESLIRFSNVRFYDDDLVVFPSTTGDIGKLGVSHVFVDEGRFSSGTNRQEAEAVVAAIVDHAMVSPLESLGVGTFNKKQAELVDELLEKRCEQDAATMLAVNRLREHENELFIKNLENVQGDERDVIFVCYTYGPDPECGKVFQRFGPINSENGWRRLNVLITRSKKRMVVFHSMSPTDIRIGPDKSRGVNAYRGFLEYAISGVIADHGVLTGRPPDSPFEVAVSRCISDLGLEAVPQVGVAGFFIDIGVRRHDGDRSFILGVECDGASYHSARSARDRDRLREEILRSRGWKIHRIWSTDWFMNQRREEEKLRQAIESAMN